VLALFLFICAYMRTEQYGKYILVSRPHRYANGWVSYASVHWLDGREWRYQIIKNQEKIFLTQGEAVEFGFDAARAWITENVDAKAVNGSAHRSQ
jgi:hypothetical protein